jgi:hypothetical protein
MGGYMKWNYTKSGKNSFIAMDCAKIAVNPLYAAWQSKAFTGNDIMLHFYILDTLKDTESMPVETLTDEICAQSGETFDAQTVRHKCAEYVSLGLLTSEKKGRALYYRLSNCFFEQLAAVASGLTDAVKFFQGVAPCGEIGSFIMGNDSIENDRFSFKHYSVAHTLEDGILLELLAAIRKNQAVSFINYSEKTDWVTERSGIPMKIFVSAATGRRYLCLYKTKERRFFNYRLDHIKSVQLLGVCEDAEKYRAALNNNLDKVWGVSFGGRSRNEIVSIKLYINEATEGYILERIAREGHGGTLTRLEENTFLYTKELFDTNDISPWIKTFIGRILQLEGTNRAVIARFYGDIKRMKELYDE